MQSLNQPQVGEDLYWECHFKLSASPPIMETWKISLLPTLFYLFLADIPFKGHLLVWMSSRQLPIFIPCCLPKHSFKPKFVPMPTAVITINELKWLNHLRPEGKCLHSVSVTICFMGSVDCTCQTFAFINRVVWCPGPFFILLNHPQVSLAVSECHECYTRRNKLGWGHQTALRSHRGCSALFGFKCPISAGKMHYQHQPQSSLSKNRTCGVRTRLVYLKIFCGWLQKFHRKAGFRVGHRRGDMDWEREANGFACVQHWEMNKFTPWDSQHLQTQQPSHGSCGWARAHLKNNIIVQRHEWKGFFFVERESVHGGLQLWKRR